MLWVLVERCNAHETNQSMFLEMGPPEHLVVEKNPRSQASCVSRDDTKWRADKVCETA